MHKPLKSKRSFLIKERHINVALFLRSYWSNVEAGSVRESEAERVTKTKRIQQSECQKDKVTENDNVHLP